MNRVWGGGHKERGGSRAFVGGWVRERLMRWDRVWCTCGGICGGCFWCMQTGREYLAW